MASQDKFTLSSLPYSRNLLASLIEESIEFVILQSKGAKNIKTISSAISELLEEEIERGPEIVRLHPVHVRIVFQYSELLDQFPSVRVITEAGLTHLLETIRGGILRDRIDRKNYNRRGLIWSYYRGRYRSLKNNLLKFKII